MVEAEPGGATLRRLASLASLTIAALLVVVKLLAWLATGSVALLTSAVDALVDLASSLVTFFGVRYAERPPDSDHRYGHGKAESVAAFTQATFLAGAAMVLAFQSMQRLFAPQPLAALNLGLWIIVGSVVSAAALVVFQSFVVRRTGSTAIAADRAHYLTDVAVNLAVLAALFLTRATGWTRADPSFALAIAFYMLWNARRIAAQALEQLLDREMSGPDRDRIRESVLAVDGVRNVHDLRTRSSGDRTFIEYHLEVDGTLSVDRGHAIGDATEAALAKLLPGTIEATAHLEPYGIEDTRLDDQVTRAETPGA